jgi:hypothetical protein
VHPNEKKKPFSLYHAHCSGTPQGAPPTKKKENLFPLTLSVVASRKGRHQQKKKRKSISAHAQCSGTPQGAPPTKKKNYFISRSV